jgi:DNA-binding GntR family transcriptional regulator
MENLFEPVKPRTVKEETAKRLRDAIISGRLKPGQHLKETAIAEQLSVSRSPIREAFHELEQEGLVTSTPNVGTFVRRFDEADVRDIFSLRTALERLACEIIIEKNLLMPEDFEQLERYADEQQEAIEARDFEQSVELDLAFHQFICHKSGHERLEKMWQSLRSQMRVLFNICLNSSPDHISHTASTDHAALVEALRQRDIERCSEIYKEVHARVAEECTDVIRSFNENEASA